MPYTIDVQSTQRYAPQLAQAVARAAHEALTHGGAADGAALTILLTDDDYVRELNRHYRAEDATTDVLSFPAGAPLPGDTDAAGYLGDIAIAVPTAERQAAAKGHATPAELQLLAVHGVLHLLGHDHLDAAEKTAMWQEQAAVLRRLGLEGIQPTEEAHDDR
jgi:probable rRNA maturation factor